MIPPPTPALEWWARKPRASGDDPPVSCEAGHQPIVNPARAGMIPGRGLEYRAYICKPRASGDDPILTDENEIGYL